MCHRATGALEFVTTMDVVWSPTGHGVKDSLWHTVSFQFLSPLRKENKFQYQQGSWNVDDLNFGNKVSIPTVDEVVPLAQGRCPKCTVTQVLSV